MMTTKLGRKNLLAILKFIFCELFCGMPLDPIRDGRRYRMGEISSLLFLIPLPHELFIEKQHLIFELIELSNAIEMMTFVVDG